MLPVTVLLRECYRKLVAATAVAGLAVMAMAAPAAGQAADFTGKTIQIIVPAGPGSGADIYARALGPFLVKHLPGSPRLQIRNVPGGGTITASNEFQLKAKPDGLTVISASLSQVLNFVLGDKRVRYDLKSWRPFIVSPQGIAVYASPSLGVKGPADLSMLKGKKLLYGGAGPAAADMRLILTFEMLGWNSTNVWGIDRGQARLSFERGEFNVSYDATSTFKRDVGPLIERKLAVPLFSFGMPGEKGKFIRDPNFPDLPTFQEAYETVHGRPPSGIEYEAWLANFAMAMTLNKFFALPAGTPDEIVAAFSTAAQKMLEDPAAAQARELVLEGYPQITGPGAEELLQKSAVIKPEILDWIDAWLLKKEGVSLRPK